jgi:inhibitor of KinA
MVKLIEVGESAVILLLSYDKTSSAVRLARAIAEFAGTYPGVLSARAGLDAVLLEHNESFDPKRFLLAVKQVKPYTAKRAAPFRVPVCYEKEFAKDLDSVTTTLGLSSPELITRLQSRTYEVWMIGFMPGYPYMGELPKRLQLQRKALPDPVIPAGSVAIAEEYVGIYPFDSPGGWHVIGRTPWSIIDYSRTRPALFEAGMRVEFYSISQKEFESMKGKFHEEARDRS